MSITSTITMLINITKMVAISKSHYTVTVFIDAMGNFDIDCRTERFVSCEEYMWFYVRKVAFIPDITHLRIVGNNGALGIEAVYKNEVTPEFVQFISTELVKLLESRKIELQSSLTDLDAVIYRAKSYLA